MHLACQGGSLQVARWLYVAGAAEVRHRAVPGAALALDAEPLTHPSPAARCPTCSGAVRPSPAARTFTDPPFPGCPLPHLLRRRSPLACRQDIHAMSNDGDTSMLLAALGGHLHVCRWLYEAGCREEVYTQNAHGNNPLHFACRQV